VTDLAGSLARYGPTYTTVPAGATASIRDVRVDGLTASGRARALVIATGAGDVTLRGNDVRYILRLVGGDILPTTSFTVTEERDAAGQLAGIVVRGRGNGHGVGMCQWGAIARARAGDDFRTILKAYYPGAELSRAP